MKIIVAQTAGFCMGVRRAVDMALDTVGRNARPLFTFGPLIHNAQTVELLESRGVHEIRDVESVCDGSTILIRAHGIPPQTESRLRERGLTILDGTCPKVKTVHKVIRHYREKGYVIIIAGDQGHAEVVGLLGYAEDAGRLVRSPEDVDTLPAFPKVCLVAQTTFDRIAFEEIAKRVREHFSHADVVIKKTICSATDRRQSETETLARRVDAMIVVGGKNSANTMRLANISRACNPNTQHVETEEEIDLSALSNCATVGITAGASTPRWLVTRVVDFLEIRFRNATPIERFYRFLEMLVNLNVFVSAGAAAAYYASCVFQHIPLNPPKIALGAMIAFLYFFSMYLWNSLKSIQKTRHFGLHRYVFYRAHASQLTVAAAVCMLAILFLASQLSFSLTLLTIVAIGAGMIYHATLIPPQIKHIFPYRSLNDIPLSRDLFVALAWGIVLTFVPHAVENRFILSESTGFTFLWISLYAFLRSVIVDLRDIEGDRILGRETLVTILGEYRVRMAIKWLIASSALVIVAAFGVRSFCSTLFYDSRVWIMQIPVPCYLWIIVGNKRHSLPALRPATFTILADIQFFLMGLCAFAAK